MLFSIVYPNGKEALLSSEMAVDDTQEEPDVKFAPVVLPEGSTEPTPTYTLVFTGMAHLLHPTTTKLTPVQILTRDPGQCLPSESSAIGW